MSAQFNDEPTLQDQFGRKGWVKLFGENMRNCQPPFVFSVHGDWGSGKTSFLHQLYHFLTGKSLCRTPGGAESQAEGNRVVLDDEIVAVELVALGSEPGGDAHIGPFLASMPRLSSRNKTSLPPCRDGWIALTALEAAGSKGFYFLRESPSETDERRESSKQHSELEREILALRDRAKSEKQISRRVAPDLEIKRIEAALGDANQKT